MGNEVMIKVENVTKYYGKQKALSDVSFEMKKGEIVGLVGPNGAGKTTLMSILVGLIKNNSGNVYIAGKNVRLPQKLKKRIIGSLIESPGVYTDLSGYENIMYFSKVFGKVEKEEIEKVVSQLGLQNAINKKVKKYSTGMKQRLGIALALLGDPQILVLDEPTNGLDPSVVPEIREIIRYYAEEKKMTVLISSHILSEIEKMCGRALILKNGQLIADMSLGETKDSKDLKDNYYVIEVEEKEEIKKHLLNKAYEVWEVDECKICVKLEDKQPAKLVTELINSGYAVNGFYLYSESLEKKFLRTIGGNVID